MPAVAGKPGRPARFDYDYERHGGSTLFMVCEPLQGWRQVVVTDQRTKIDWAQVIRDLVDRHL